MKRIAWVVGCLVLSIGGCATSPAPPASPAEGVAIQGLPLRWWEGFQDPALDRLVTLALDNNLDLKSAIQRIREQRALRRQSSSALFPILRGTGSAEASHNASDGADRSYLYGVDLTWEIDLFGRLRAQTRAAEANMQATAADYQALRVSLVADVISTYLRYRLAREEETIAQQAADNQQQTANITRIRFKGGTASGFDVERLEAQVNITRATIPAAREQAESSRYGLAYLLNRDQTEIDSILAQAVTPKQPLMPDVTALMALPATSLRNRPDVYATELRLQASTAELDAAKALRYPQLTLGALVGFEQGSGTPAWSISGQVFQPLVNFGQIRAAIEASDARQQQAWLTYQAALLQALREVRSALASYGQGMERQQLLALATHSAANARALARHQYEAGTVSLIEVLDAERVYFDARLDQVQATTDVLLKWTEIFRTLGLSPSA
ncbi:TolC family protein [Pseudomonas luteola]|uniref:TolC family protein n=1 Tax=Pseudomonas luteola TaxID=47886 RepID=UPI0012396561|nr:MULTISPECIES: TolC family protein [Pseudomonas]MBA1246274.1 TolC family protein [Pseudomonas zeshuii]QEU26976.1 TolC family protein [Pseudomonas luteola]